MITLLSPENINENPGSITFLYNGKEYSTDSLRHGGMGNPKPLITITIKITMVYSIQANTGSSSNNNCGRDISHNGDKMV